MSKLTNNYETEIFGNTEWEQFKTERDNYLKTEEASKPPDIEKVKKGFDIDVERSPVIRQRFDEKVSSGTARGVRSSRMLDNKNANSKLNLIFFNKNKFSPDKKRKHILTTHGSARSHSGFGVRFVKMIRPDIHRNTAKDIFNVNHKKIVYKKLDPYESKKFESDLKKMKMDEKVVQDYPRVDKFQLDLRNKKPPKKKHDFIMEQMLKEFRLQ